MEKNEGFEEKKSFKEKLWSAMTINRGMVPIEVAYSIASLGS